MPLSRLLGPRLAGTISLVLLCLLLAAPAVATWPVSVVPSDDAALARPVGRAQDLTADQVLAMVRRAVDLVGGMGSVVPDTARLVLLKPNVGTDALARSGIITDDRVVRAVALLVHEVAPRARILIAEGSGGWISPALAESVPSSALGGHTADGFELAGLRAVARELRAQGLEIDCFDLNFDRVYSLNPPGGGLAAPEYSVAAAVLDADVWINLPVAKTHGAKITCCLKNHFGLLPGRLYGWSKSSGTASHPGMPHSPRLMDEAWLDLYGLTRVDLNVVDMIAGSQAGAFEENDTKRCNLVLAGRNPVATDLVVGRLMGFNPDDFEFAELAWQNDLGPRTIDSVEVRGAAVEPLISRWKKAGTAYGSWGEWSEHATYGMGPRYWSLLGPFPRDHAWTPAELAALDPVPGQDGWSPAVYFGSDQIDLDKQFDDPVDCSVYAFTRFTMTRSDSVRFWVGSDEGLTVWLDGRPVYEHQGRRRHVLGMNRAHGYVEAGEHLLLVRADQTRGGFDFSINVCEPIDDERYAGNRYPGIRYRLDRAPQPASAARRIGAESIGDQYAPSEREASLLTFDAADPIGLARTAPDTVLLESVPQPRYRDLVGLMVQYAGLERPGLDAATLAALASTPFTMGHTSFGREGNYPEYGPSLTRVLDWLGLRYAIDYGHGRREALKVIHGWLAQGRVPLTAHLARRSGRRWRGSRQAEWAAVTGFRRHGPVTELRLARPDTTYWIEVGEDWIGVLPGGLREGCPVVVAAPDGKGVTGEALVDTLAGLALELGLSRELSYGAQDSLGSGLPGGLAAWDWWVIDWERLPLTSDWAVQPDVLDRLERLGSRFPPELAAGREQAAGFFAAAAARTSTGRRRQLLEEAAAGYREVAEAMHRLARAMPRNDSVESLTAEDREALDRIGQTRPLVRRARDGERRALVALGRLLGRPELPAVIPDPLARRAQGVRLFTWRAKTEDTVYDLVFTSRDLAVEEREGNAAGEPSVEVHAAMPRTKGWIAAVEPGPAGGGVYRVVEQPAAANGWRLVVRADDRRAWRRDNAPELTVWAVPGE